MSSVRPQTRSLATALGLLLALGGPLVLFSPLAARLGDEGEPATLVRGQLVLWALALALLGIVLLWEKRPLASIGWKVPSWRTALLGVAAALVLLYVVTPLGVWLVAALGLGGFETGLAKIRGQPLAYLIFAGVTAGVVEELLYRGYAVERLAAFTGNLWLGGLLAWLAFGAVHLPFWGLGPAVFTLLPGLVLTLLYLWQRDLAANMLAHALTAVVQLVPYAEGATGLA